MNVARTRIVVFLLIQLLAWQMVVAERTPERVSGGVEPGAPTAIPLKWSWYLLVAEVTINGETLNLAVDTGTTATVLFAPAAERVGLRMNPMPGHGRSIDQKKLPIQLGVADRVEMGSAWLANEGIGVIDEVRGLQDIDGMLGNSTLMDWDVRVDPQNCVMQLFTPGTILKSVDEILVPLHTRMRPIADVPGFSKNAEIFIPISVRSKNMWVVPDTGSGGTLTIGMNYLPQADRRKIDTDLPAFGASVGVAGVVKNWEATLPRLDLAGFQFNDIPSAVIPRNPKNGSAGNLGLMLLGQFAMNFRFSSSEMGFEPLGKLVSPTFRSALGFKIFPSESTVIQIDEKSPAYAAGIQNGDVIVEIEGVSPARRTIRQILETRSLPVGSPLEVVFERDGVRRKVEVISY